MNAHQIIYNAARKVLTANDTTRSPHKNALLIADIACLRLAVARRRKLKAAVVRWMPEGRK